MEIRVVTPPLAPIGEGPVWDVETQRLYWVDIAQGNIFATTADGRETSVVQFPGRVTCIALRANGEIVVTSGPRLYLFDPDSDEVELLFEGATPIGWSFNDGKADRQGRFVTGIVEQSFARPEGLHSWGR
jgi:L-arabinonolactonase